MKINLHVIKCVVIIMQEEGKPFPLEPGSATIHHGRTVHYSRGNSTDTFRRGFIVNCRPASMVEYERKNKFDHGKAVCLQLLLHLCICHTRTIDNFNLRLTHTHARTHKFSFIEPIFPQLLQARPVPRSKLLRIVCGFLHARCPSCALSTASEH